MRIHEILEACVDYIAIDGVLGTDPAVLQQHLSTIDPAIDEAYFTHIYGLLTDHPSIQVIITTYPLPSPCTTQTGSAPLPEDYIDPEASKQDVNINDLLKDGVRGRQMAFHLAGEEFKTSKQAIEVKREEAKKLAKEKRASKQTAETLDQSKTKAKASDEELYKVLGSGEREDLMELWEVWGARLRVRVTDDEIYFRLTGSYTKISKLSPIVFHTLSLAAKSREKGITSIELGPMVGTSQGSMHYFMKVLVDMGLCAKIPAVIHGSITNSLVFHRFVDQNAGFKAIAAQKMIPEKPARDDTLVDHKPLDLRDLAFGTLTEPDLLTGHVMKERLIRVLDHPSLNNHLLRAKNLLPVLGWEGPHVTRHNRAVLRHVEALVSEGIVESLFVGEDGVKCLRLTKYNPDYVQPAVGVPLDDDDEDEEIEFEEIHDSYNPLGGASATRSIEHQMHQAIIDSDQRGMTIVDLRDALGGMYKRAIEFHVLHSEAYVPPHLRPLATCIVMEMVGRERRLRAFGVAAYRARMISEGQPLDPSVHPPNPIQSGHWSDLSHLQFYYDSNQYNAVVEILDDGDLPEDILKPKATKTPKAVVKKSAPLVRERSESEQVVGKQPRVKKNKKEFLYGNEVQSRGRPRKYVYVVNDDGKRNRAIIGSIYSSPELPSILIYVRSADKLVPGPPGYSGVGPPPPITPEMLAEGQTPKFYWQFPTHSPAVGNTKAIDQYHKEHGRSHKDARNPGKNGKEKATDTSTPAKGKKRKREASPRPPPVQVDVEQTESNVEGTKRAKVEPGPNEDIPGVVDGAAVDQAAAPLAVGLSISPGDSANPIEVPETSVADIDIPTRPILPDTEVDLTITTSDIAIVDSPASTKPKRKPAKRKSAVADGTASPVPIAKEKKSKKKDAQVILREPSSSTPLFSVPRGTPPPTAFELPADISGILRPDAGESDDLIPSMAFQLPFEFTTLKRPPKSVEEQPPTPSSEVAIITAEPTRSPPRIQAEPTLPASTSSQVREDHSHAARTREPEESLQLNDNGPSVVDAEGHPGQSIDLAEYKETIPSVLPTPETPKTPIIARQIAPTILTPDEGEEALRSIKEYPVSPVTGFSAAKARRPDLGFHRRAMELYQCLVDNGGIMVSPKLMHEHRNWASRVAGTDWPNAPMVSASFDRKTFTKAINSLLSDRKLRETIATIPTTTGRWQKTVILYLEDKPQSEVQTYIRAIAASVSSLGHRKTAKAIPQMEYTEIAPAPNPTTSLPAIPPPVESDRDALLRDPNAVCYLYGYQSGRMLRAEIMHRQLVQNLSTSPSIISSSPTIFALPLFFEDVALGDWLKCIATFYYDEGLHDLAVRAPDTKLRDVPKELRPSGGFGGHSAKGKLAALLDILVTLRLLTPLASTQENPVIQTPKGDFALAESAITAKYFLVHDFAPVYHIATDESKLLGILPSRSAEDLDTFWGAARQACFEENLANIDPLRKDVPGFPITANLPDQLELPTERKRTFQSLPRWRHHYRLHPAQQSALQDAYRADLTPEEMAEFAYDWALPISVVERNIQTRKKRIAVRKETHVKEAKESEEKYREKQKRATESLQVKLVERAAAARKEWEERIQAAAERNSVPYDQTVFGYVSRQRLQHLSVEWTDKMLDEAILSYVRTKTAAPPKHRVLQWKLQRRAAVDPLPSGRTRRKRHNFTAEDDDKLLDMEAIIRARQRPSPMNPPRLSFSQVYPEIGRQTIAARIRRILSIPGKQAYLERLEEAWYLLWQEHKEVDLPDPNPKDMTTFDMVAHLQYLRNNINKLNIRLAVALPLAPKDRVPDLPADLDVLISTYKWSYKPFQAHGFIVPSPLDTPNLSEETRTLNLALGSLIDDASKRRMKTDKTSCIVQCLIKMIIATSGENYDVKAATELIQPYESFYHRDVASLIDQGILLKHNNGKFKPGRQYAFATQWIEKGEGPYPEELHEAAESLTVKLEAEETYTWPLVGETGGDIAALLQMVSNHEIDIDFNASTFPTLALEQSVYNTKQLNDDSFEFDLEVSRIERRPEAKLPCPLSHQPRRALSWNIPLEFDVSSIAENIVSAIVLAQGEGLSKPQMKAKLKIPAKHLAPALAYLAEEDPQRVFWAGYDTARLVSTEFSQTWTVAVQDRSKKLPIHRRKERHVVPRRWYDIWGDVSQSDWEKTVRAVKGHIVARPGLSEAVLRELIAPILDRLETNDVLQYILNTGEARRAQVNGESCGPVEATDVAEEKDVSWWPNIAVLWH